MEQYYQGVIEEFPILLHGNIMKRVILIRYVRCLIIKIVLISINLCILGWHFIYIFFTQEIISFLKIIFGNFVFNLNYAYDIGAILTQNVSIIFLILFSLSFILGIYFVYLLINDIGKYRSNRNYLETNFLTKPY